MARRLPFGGRSSGGAFAASRRARGGRRFVRASLCECRSVRTQPRVSAYRHVSAQSPLRHERHAAGSALHELGARVAPGWLRSRAVRLHAHRAGSALHDAGRSAARHRRGHPSRHHAGGRHGDALRSVARLAEAVRLSAARRSGATYGQRCRRAHDAAVPRPSLYSADHTDTIPRAERDGLRRNACPGEPGWAVHLSGARAHPPWVAAQPYNTRYPLRALPPAVRRDDVEAECCTRLARSCTRTQRLAHRRSCGIGCCRRVTTA